MIVEVIGGTLERPEARVVDVDNLTALHLALGEVTDEGTEQFLRGFIEAFDVFVARVLNALPPERLGATG